MSEIFNKDPEVSSSTSSENASEKVSENAFDSSWTAAMEQVSESVKPSKEENLDDLQPIESQSQEVNEPVENVDTNKNNTNQNTNNEDYEFTKKHADFLRYVQNNKGVRDAIEQYMRNESAPNPQPESPLFTREELSDFADEDIPLANKLASLIQSKTEQKYNNILMQQQQSINRFQGLIDQMTAQTHQQALEQEFPGWSNSVNPKDLANKYQELQSRPPTLQEVYRMVHHEKTSQPNNKNNGNINRMVNNERVSRNQNSNINGRPRNLAAQPPAKKTEVQKSINNLDDAIYAAFEQYNVM